VKSRAKRPHLPDIAELCRRHSNEDAHTWHVAVAALRIFDSLPQVIRLPADARPLLECAALLHDIGYARDPDNHGAAGAQLIMREGVSGLSRLQTRIVACAVLMHQGAPAAQMSSRLFAPLSARDRDLASRIAAILRVADGLDHRHDQRTEIRSASMKGTVFRVAVSGQSASLNVPWALAKADLWEDAFGVPIAIEPCVEENKETRNRKEPAVSAARRLLSPLLRDIKEKARAAAHGDDPEHLHDLRGAIRRFRSVLGIAAPLLSDTSARRVRKALSRLNDSLGRVRDTDILLLLRARYLGRGGQKIHAQPPEARRKAILRILSSELWLKTVRQASILTRSELPALEARSPSPPAGTFAADRLARLIKRIARQPRPHPDMPPEDLHSLRKLCRRGRYWCEMFGDCLGSAAARHGRRFRAVAEALGSIRDIEMAMQKSKEARIPQSAYRSMRTDRDRLWKTARREWKRLAGKAAARRMLRDIRKHSRI